jgi:hypothetical protein
MAEIGASLREARMRQRLDITDVEVQTKIRAKYLRALENEEWDLLPGPTYVKSFLRTYGEALGLDAKLLVEEFKLRHERPAPGEMNPVRQASRRERRRSGRPPRAVPRWVALSFVLLAICGALMVVGLVGEEETPDPASREPVVTEPGPGDDRRAGGDDGRQRERREPRRSRTVRLAVVPTGPVWVCLEAAGGRRLIPGVELAPGSPRRTYRSRRFRITLGTGNATLRVNGRALGVPDSAGGIGYEITRSGRRTLPPNRRPSCS